MNVTFKTETCFDHHQCNPGCNIYLYIKIIWIKLHDIQGFQSGPVPGTFNHLRSCIVPAEITEPPTISGGQNQKYDGQ